MTQDIQPQQQDEPDSDRLNIRTTERGFDFHQAVPSQYGGGVQVSESSNASYAGVWLRAAAVPGMVTVSDTNTEVAINLLATNAWQIARQLARTVTHHYQGDARPIEARDAARAAVADITGWGPSVAETLLRRLAHHGFVLVDVGAAVPAEAERELEPVATVTFTAGENVEEEPVDGELVALYTPSDAIEQVHIRDDSSVDEEEHDEDERWFPVGGDDDDTGPSTWRELRANAKDGWKLVRLHRGSMPPGVSVVKEWGVWSTDGTVYEVNPPTEDKAVYEATLLYRGDATEPGERGCAPASRYVMRYPGVPGMANRVDSGWSRPSTWAPPPVKLTDEG